MGEEVDVRARLGAVEGGSYKSGGIIPFSTSVEGLESSGKTYYSLMTMPTPIVHVAFGDRDADLFLEKMDEERRKQVVLYKLKAESPSGWTRQEGNKSLGDLKDIALGEMGGGKLAGGTFVLDSGSNWWEVIQEVKVAPVEEKLRAEAERAGKEYKQAGGFIYGPGNLFVKSVINWLKAQGAFVILTHKKTQEWDAKGPIPYKYRAQANKEVRYMVEVRLDLYKTCAECNSEWCEARTHQGRRHWGQLLKFAGNDSLEGFAWEDPSFAMLYSLYTGQSFPEPERLPKEGE